MALIKCPECGKDVGNNLSFCPHCGFRLKKRNVILLVVNISLLFFAIGLLFFLVFSIIQTNQDKTIIHKKTAIKFVEELPSNCVIMETIMDSTINKIFYYKNEELNVEFRCFDVSKSTDNIITTQNISNVSNYYYDKKNRCIFVIVKTKSDKLSNRYSLFYIGVDNNSSEIIANGIAIFFINRNEIRVEKTLGRDIDIDFGSNSIDEILKFKDDYRKDYNNWDL